MMGKRARLTRAIRFLLWTVPIWLFCVVLFSNTYKLADSTRFRVFPERQTTASNTNLEKSNGGSRQKGTCAVHTNTTWSYFSDTSKIRRNRDWNFTQKVKCPKLTITTKKLLRRKASISCDNGTPELLFPMTSSPRDIQIFEPDDQCLQKFVRHCCHDDKPVPNLMHYIWIADVEVNFFTFVSFISVVRFMRPCLIMFHGPFVPKGKYWNYFIRLFPEVVLVNESLVTSIYGHELRYIEHGSDVMRIHALLNYGGLYLDWDAVLVKPIDVLRKNQCSVSLEDQPNHIGSQVILSEKDGEFLKLWLDGYKNYTDIWEYNAIVYPYNLSKVYPQHVSVLGYKLLVSKPMKRVFLWHKYSNWSANYALHFFLRGYHKKREVTLKSIRTMRTTIAAVIRHVLFGSKEQCLN